MKPINFRSAYSSDAESLLEVHKAAILELGLSAYTSDECKSWAHGLNAHGYQTAMDKGERFIVAVLVDEIIGFCSYDCNEIIGLFVAPNKARLGVGTQLLKGIEESIHANGAKQINLNAALSAVSFYKAQGYVKLQEEPWLTRGGRELVSLRMSKCR